ncbi:MAG: hypothetical protein VYD34_04815 [Verrucomicrobiota bacterium]|nr:hypothetical protein [Verrucomicrobiota bacterium]MEE2813272.1 hypothetical protein [Verrucomicrobiota bacterium]
MSEPVELEAEARSPWPRRLAVGCVSMVVLLLVGMFVFDLIVRKMVADRIEKELAQNGWQAQLDGFDYSLWNKEVEIYGFSGVSMDEEQHKQFGEVRLNNARVKFNADKENILNELIITEAQAKFGKLDKLEIVPGKKLSAKDLIINNPEEFGGGPLIEINELKVVFGGITKEGRQRYKKVEIQIGRINLVKNMKGKWLTDGASQFQMKLRNMESQKGEGEIPEVDSLSVNIGEVALLDLSQKGTARVVQVNQVIEENNNPKGYALGVFLRIIGVIANAKNLADP